MSRADRPERPTFLRDRRGAVTLDWTALAAAVVIAAVGAVALVGDDALRFAETMLAEDDAAAASAMAVQRAGLSAAAPEPERARAPATLFRPEAPELVPAVLDEAGAPAVARRSDTGGRGAFDPALAEPDRPTGPEGPVLAMPVGAGAASPGLGALETGCLRDRSDLAGETRAAGWIGAVADERPDCPAP